MNQIEQETSGGLEFQQTLSEIARQSVSDELKSNRIAKELLFAIYEEKFPKSQDTATKTPFSVLAKFVDSRKGTIEDRLLDAKLDFLDFIETNMGREEKQERYKTAVERLFQTIGMGSQREYEVLAKRLQNSEEARRDLMERRKKELEAEYKQKR